VHARLGLLVLLCGRTCEAVVPMDSFAASHPCSAGRHHTAMASSQQAGGPQSVHRELERVLSNLLQDAAQRGGSAEGIASASTSEDLRASGERGEASGVVETRDSGRVLNRRTAGLGNSPDATGTAPSTATAAAGPSGGREDALSAAENAEQHRLLSEAGVSLEQVANYLADSAPFILLFGWRFVVGHMLSK
jgi:hypothetical protein